MGSKDCLERRERRSPIQGNRKEVGSVADFGVEAKEQHLAVCVRRGRGTGFEVEDGVSGFSTKKGLDSEKEETREVLEEETGEEEERKETAQEEVV